MIAARRVFEAHLTVRDLERSMAFYGDVLGLTRAHHVPERAAAFYWVGRPGESMLGLWEGGHGPQRTVSHVAFEAAPADVVGAPAVFRAAGMPPLDLHGRPCEEAVVLAWMPAVAVYVADPDGHLIEYLAMLAGPARPDLGVMPWSAWARGASGGAPVP